jgi:hypothetical protein
MKTRILLTTCAAILVIGFSWYLQAQTTELKQLKIPASMKSEVKLSPEEARATASKKVPGVTREEDLARENGKLVYLFDIQATGRKDITEVQLSAIDGSVVSIEKEDAVSEAKDEQQEAAKKPKPGTPPQR